MSSASVSESITSLVHAAKVAGNVGRDALRALVNLRQTHAEASRELAKLIIDGHIELSDAAESDLARLNPIELLNDAHVRGDPEAPFVLAQVLERESPSDSDTAVRVRALYSEAARRGFVDAYTNLGWCLRTGYGGPADLDGAHELWLLAAKWGDSIAQANLARDYEIGIGGHPNRALAEHWYRLASAGGFHEATVRLADLLWDSESLEEKQQAVRLWERVWSSNADCETRGKAAYALGNAYETGLVGGKTVQDAVALYEDGASLDDELCLVNLGWILYNGEGVNRDPVRAVALYRRAAELGNLSAMYNLGVAYEEGEGVTQSVNDALRWYLAASQNGHEASSEAAERIRKRLSPT